MSDAEGMTRRERALAACAYLKENPMDGIAEAARQAEISVKALHRAARKDPEVAEALAAAKTEMTVLVEKAHLRDLAGEDPRGRFVKARQAFLARSFGREDDVYGEPEAQREVVIAGVTMAAASPEVLERLYAGLTPPKQLPDGRLVAADVDAEHLRTFEVTVPREGA